MSDLDVLAMLHKKPFEPFGIQVSDSTVYEIRHPEMVLPTITSLHIGISAPKQGHKYERVERVEIVSLDHVVKLLPLATATNA